jgi:uncharacterized cupredoxin-like copper-binding protein
MANRMWLAAAVVALAGSAVACSGDEPAAAPSPELGIVTTLTDFAIRPAETEGSAGEVAFDLVNDGPSDHSFFLVRTDRADDDLPVVDHVVDTSQLEVVEEVERIEFAAEQAVALDLEAGNYVMFCNLPGHYESDMHAAFTVT